MAVPMRVAGACLWLLLAGRLCSAQLQDKETFFHTCDASAGLAIGDKLFAVASDEDNWLRIYDPTQPGPPVQAVNLAPLLGIASGKEMDIEGATQIGDTSYWITSHGANASGEPAPSRQILFAMRVEITDGLVSYSVVGSPYRKLLNDLIDAPTLAEFDFRAASKRPPKEPGALNIEGLCSLNGQLLIGFRNPVRDGKALLLPLTNVPALVGRSDEQNVAAEFGEPISLDLGGRGIRSIEYDAEQSVFWIVAGRFDGERDFALYRWKGAGHAPRNMDVEFGKWNPEALTIWPNQGAFQILSDDGERTLEEVDEDQSCKDLSLENRRFRSGWLELPD